MSLGHTITSALARDVSLWGLTSPLLSWIGSAGLFMFFAWQASRLFTDAARFTAPFLAIRPLLRSLAARAEASEQRLARDRTTARGRAVLPAEDASAADAPDLDQLTELDQAMRRIGAFRRPWGQFQKTLLVERVPWFREPHVFSTRRAEEFFTHEAAVASQIDLAFYGQVPSLITGFGLVLTFVAICIGLSRLHAEGQDISGIQGLVNGLAGKFLSSIVGLVCANVFVLLERPTVRRLLAAHAEFVALLDESFPRRTVEDLLDALGQHRSDARAPAEESQMDAPDRATRVIWQDLGQPIDELSSAVRALSVRMEKPDDTVRTLIAAVEQSQSRADARIATLVNRLATALDVLAPPGSPAARRERELRAVTPAPRDGAEDVGGGALALRPAGARGRRHG